MRKIFLLMASTNLLLTPILHAQDANASADSPPIVIVAQPPATRLDSFENQTSVVVTRGTERQSPIGGDDGSTLTVIAVEMSVPGTDKKQTGIALELSSRNGRLARAYVDAEDLPSLIAALDSMSKLDKSSSKLSDWDACYHAGNVRIANVDVNGSRAALVRVIEYTPVTSQLNWSTARFRGARLAEIRQQVIAAQKALQR